MLNVAVIGGGAAGFFAAISVKAHFPSAQVTLFERTSKVLSKVLVSGGGRCNVTNGSTHLKELIAGYPRGARLLKKAFREFDNHNTMAWFQSRGVELKTEPDGRVFPVTDDSQTIVDCLIKEATKHEINVRTSTPVDSIERTNGRFVLSRNPTWSFDKVIVASGGSPKPQGLQWLSELGHKIESPVPSLFTFNMPKNPITKLMGIVSENTGTRIQGTKLKSSGPLLITHWGMSGPAILKLSAFGARVLNEMNYEFTLQVNWTGGLNDQHIQQDLLSMASSSPNKKLVNLKPYGLPERLWAYLLGKCELSENKTWSELGKKGTNKLTSILANDQYPVKGKTTFKEEFVTAGGVSLESINPMTLESRVCDGLYFAGEVLDIDGITGGYNFQGAWTTGYIAGQLRHG